ncbi:hypothetical protein BN1723_020280, partial [Verticillium longisporum]
QAPCKFDTAPSSRRRPRSGLTKRTRNYNQPCKTTKARSGALLPTRSGLASRQPRAESAHKNFLRVLY